MQLRVLTSHAAWSAQRWDLTTAEASGAAGRVAVGVSRHLVTEQPQEEGTNGGFHLQQKTL